MRICSRLGRSLGAAARVLALAGVLALVCLPLAAGGGISGSGSPLAPGKAGAGLDGGVRLQAAWSFDAGAGGHRIGVRALPFFSARGFELSLVAFDNLLLPWDEDKLRAWYAFPKRGFLDQARHLLKFVDRIRYGTPKSRFHLHLGPRESLDFAPGSVVATMDGDLDRFSRPGARRLQLVAAYNSDKWDWRLFLDDLDKSAGGTLRGGLRVAATPFGAYRLEIGAGAYGSLRTLRPFAPSLAPFADLTFPIVDKSSFKASFCATALCGPLRESGGGREPGGLMVEGSFPMEAFSGRLRIAPGVAWNRGHRFSSAFNDTKAGLEGGCAGLSDPAWDISSIDLILRLGAVLAGHLEIEGYLDLPFGYDGQAAGPDVSVFKLGWNGPVWGCAFKYSVMGLFPRLEALFASFGGAGPVDLAWGALLGGNSAVASLEGRLRLGCAAVSLDLGFAPAETLRPVAALRLVLDLSRGGIGGK